MSVKAKRTKIFVFLVKVYRSVPVFLCNNRAAKEKSARGKEKMRRKKLRKSTAFRKTLEELLSLAVPSELVPSQIKNAVGEETLNYQEVILLAQILKAANGDTQSAVFLRDTSGNKLKDGERPEEIKRKFEDF